MRDESTRKVLRLYNAAKVEGMTLKSLVTSHLKYSNDPKILFQLCADYLCLLRLVFIYCGVKGLSRILLDTADSGFYWGIVSDYKK